jgi:hypothetical protein
MKKGSAIVLLLAISITSIAQKRDFEWAKNTFSDQGNAPTVVSSSMVVKPSGDMYLAGSNGKVGNGVDFGAPCLAKYKSDGAVDWVKYFPDGNNSGTGTEYLLEDSNGDLIAMYYGSELDFDGNPTPLSPKYVLVKFDTSGEVKWVNYFGGNQIHIRDVKLSQEGNVAIVVDGQAFSTADTSIYPGNDDVLAVMDGDNGGFLLTEIAGYTPTNGYHTFSNMFPHNTNSMVCITSEGSTFSPVKSFITEIDLSDNSIVKQDTIENIAHTSTMAVQRGTILKILEYNPVTQIAYVSGRAKAEGVPIGNDSIFGVNPNNASMFLAKMNFSTGEILNKVVYYTPGTQEGVQRAVLGNNQITFFIVYRDTIRNAATGDVYTSIDTLPNNGPHPHCLIQNFDLDLNLNYYNQSARIGGTSTCNSAGYDAVGNLYMLYASGSNQYFDHTFLNTQETNVLARIGNTVTGIDQAVPLVQVSVYPNPASDFVHVVASEQIQSLRIFNLAGQVLQCQNSGDAFNVSELSSGVYFVEITMEGKTLLEKLVVN